MTDAADQSPLLLTIALPDEAATARLAEDIAVCLGAGDTVALRGGLGAGKTTFARALLRAIADDPGLEVPSPTFTLVQSYETDRLKVAHFDFYRLSGPEDVDETGFSEALDEGAVLVEWPERAGDRIPAEALSIAFEIDGAGRIAQLSCRGPLAARVERSMAIREFLDRSGWERAARRHLVGDASNRRFERVGKDNRSAVLMDWLPGSQLSEDDPRTRFRARTVDAFIAVDGALRAAGLSAPQLYGADRNLGFVLMEDFGGEGLVIAGRPDPGRYEAAIDMLAEIHARPRPAELPVDGGVHRVPTLSQAALMVEIVSFLEWFVPAIVGKRLPEAAEEAFRAIWSDLSARLAGAEQNWVLFDVQSANLFWLEGGDGIARIGLIDFQDMFLGPAAYDVASLCLDARVTIPPALEAALRDRYVQRRRDADPAFDPAAFRQAYAISAASRIVKNLGAFSRLIAQGKSNYINHLPRSREYLARVLAEPVLSSLAVWYEDNLSS